MELGRELRIYTYSGSPSGLSDAVRGKLRWHGVTDIDIVSTSESMSTEPDGNTYKPILHYTMLYYLRKAENNGSTT